MRTYDAISARARGLATHLLSAGEWTGLAEAPDLPTLAGRLEQGREPLHLLGPATGEQLEQAARRRAGERLGSLARWCGNHPEVLEVVFGDEDRRSIRALVRGAVAAAPAEARLAATLPTPMLPLRALENLAAQPSLARVAALLVAWRHPAASALDPAPRAGPPDFLALEAGLMREFAGRALRAAGNGDATLRWHTRTLVDLENLLLALEIAVSPAELQLSALFVGGGAIPLGALERVARAPSRLAALQEAQDAFRHTVFAGALTEVEPSRLVERLTSVLRAHLHRTSRVEPLGSAPVLDYALRLREETRRLQRLAWALELDAPLEERLGEVGAR